MSTTKTRVLATTLALALVATAAVAGTTIAQPSENTTQSTGSFAYDGETLLVQNATGQTIRGETSLPAGTDVTLSLKSSGPTPFLKTATATVGENGTFAATFDLSDVAADAPLQVSARANGTEIAETEGRIVEELPETTARTTTATETTSNESGQPGFGVSAALVALCAALLVRRD